MNYTFDSIAGYKREKAELMRLCEIFNNRGKYEAKGAKLPKGIIFFGEAGTGKTLFAKVMADTCGLRVFKIDLAEIESETAICKTIRKTFALAAKCGEPAMVFFDEVDKVLPNYNEDYVTDRSKTVLTQLLTLIDGMNSATNIVFVATCNDYDDLPETLTRPGRIDKKIGIGLPNYSSRVAILKMYASRTPCTFEMAMEEIAKLANNFSCAALETLINECILQADDNGFVSRSLLQGRFFEIKNEDILRDTISEDDAIRACRNVGSFVIARTMNGGTYTLNLDNSTACNDFFNRIFSDYVSTYLMGDNYDEDDEISEYDSDHDYDDDGEGYYDEFGNYINDRDDFDDDDDDDVDDVDEKTETPASFFSKTDLINAITVRLGGYAAEEIVYNDVYDNVKKDLNLIDSMLFSMSANGMFGLSRRFSPVREDNMCYSDAWTDCLYTTLDNVLEECYIKAKAVVEKNEQLIRKLIPILVEKRVIDKKDCEPILYELGGIRK